MSQQNDLPRYRCHKEVHALKIERLDLHTPKPAPEGEKTDMYSGGGTITPEGDLFAAFQVSPEYLHKHKPLPGGYWVLYADGYQSYSPAEAFEDGYTLIQPKDARVEFEVKVNDKFRMVKSFPSGYLYSLTYAGVLDMARIENHPAQVATIKYKQGEREGRLYKTAPALFNVNDGPLTVAAYIPKEEG